MEKKEPQSVSPKRGLARPETTDDFLVKAVLLDEPAAEIDQPAENEARAQASGPEETVEPAGPQGGPAAEEPGAPADGEDPRGHLSPYGPTASPAAAEGPPAADEVLYTLPGRPEEGQAPPPLKIFRPSPASIWYMFFGLLLGPAIIYFERDPQGNQMVWLALSLLFLGLIIHRISLKYSLSRDYIKIESWWGLGREELMPLAALSEVRVMQGFVGRLASTAQLDLISDRPDEPGLIILGQRNFRELAEELDDLAARARFREGSWR